jgi:hypothetical protein
MWTKLRNLLRRPRRVLCDGKPVDTDARCVPVSRHGLEENGVTCPSCGILAVQPADWSKVARKRDKAGKIIQEAVSCPGCSAFLMASPDDALDPIKPGEKYDETVYHCFVRPPDWTPPRQQYLNRPLAIGDWICLANLREIPLAKRTPDVLEVYRERSDTEGTVVSIEGETTTIRMIGGLGDCFAQTLHDFPTHILRPMRFETFRVGSHVKILYGEAAGSTGTVLALERGGYLVVQTGHMTITIHTERATPV